MAQTIRLKRSSDTGHTPTADDITLGELAINTADGTVFMRKNDDTIINIAGHTYTAGDGISISDDHVISSEGLAAGGTNFVVQVNDGHGKLSFVPLGPKGRVLTSQGTDVPTWEDVPVSGGTVRSVKMDGGETGITFSPEEIKTTGTFTMDGVLNIEHGGTGGSTPGEIIANILPDQKGHQGGMLKTDGAGNLIWEVPPGSNYSAGVGLELDGTTFNTTIADNTGDKNKITVSKGDGTLLNLDSGTAGQVLVSRGDTDAPYWDSVNGTVTKVSITRVPEMGMYISGGNTTVDPNTKEITKTGTIGLNGTLSVAYGGTGADNVVDARTKLLPSQTDHANKVLMSNGTDVSWGIPAGLDGTVKSVAASGGDTGLSFSGGPIVTSGTLTLGGKLGVSAGGTGADNVVDARTNLLPKQTDHANKVLMSNGTDVSWGIPAGLDGTVKSVDIDGGDTGMKFSGGPVTTTGKFTLSGKLKVDNGGTGVDNMTDLLTAVLPKQSDATNGKFLTTNDGTVTWGTPSGLGGTVTSVGFDGGETGLTTTGGPVTTSGTIKLGGKLSVEHGGTGADNAADAINALVPGQNGNKGKILSTDGEKVSWTTASAGSVTSVQVDGGVTGMSFTGGPITESGMITLTGTLALASGGTGATSAVDAIKALLPDQSTHAGQALVTDGEKAYWSDTTGTGTVTSVAIDAKDTGLTFSGGPITTRGTFTVGGKLSIANGGTGATTAVDAFTALAPAQKDKAGFVLSSNGTSANWTSLKDLSIPAAGSDTQLMYNKSGVLAGYKSLTFDEVTLTVPKLTVAEGGVDVTGGSWSNYVAVSGGNIDLSKGNVFKAGTSTAATTWTFTTPTAGKSYIFALSIANAGQNVQTWPTSVQWTGNTAPTLSSVGVDVLIFFTDDGGTTWRGAVLTNYSA